MADNKKLALSRREILGGLGAAGLASAGAGLGTVALFSDAEQFSNNLLEAGEFDLKVDWQVNYYNGLAPDPETISDSDTDGDGDPDLVDDPGPIVDLQDVKPGDVIEHTLSAHLFGNPGFITMDGLITADDDAGFTEPEDQVDGTLDDADGTPDGDLDNHLQCVVWFDDGDGLPQEIWNTSYSQRDAFIDDLINGNVSFDTSADEFVFQGTFASVMAALSGTLLLDPQVDDNVASSYPGSQCFAPSTTQYIGLLCWLPRDIPGVNDNIIQSDRLEYQLGFNANQCRNNIADDGSPINRPTGGVQPLTFEVTEGYGTLDGGPVDLQSDVGFPEDMVTSVDTSSDPVEFVLDLPEELDKSAGDQWELVFDADDDGTVDFRVVFDEFFYQEWDTNDRDKDEDGWGDEQPVPADIKTAVVDGIYIVRVPRDRLSDPFAFAGRGCYNDPPNVSELGDDEGLCVSFTPDLVPRDEVGPDTSGFQKIAPEDQLPEKLLAQVSAVETMGDQFRIAGAELESDNSPQSFENVATAFHAIADEFEQLEEARQDVFRSIGDSFQNISELRSGQTSEKQGDELASELNSIKLELLSVAGGLCGEALLMQDSNCSSLFEEAHLELLQSALTLTEGGAGAGADAEEAPSTLSDQDLSAMQAVGKHMRRSGLAISQASDTGTTCFVGIWDNECDCGTIRWEHKTKNKSIEKKNFPNNKDRSKWEIVRICVKKDGMVCTTCEWEDDISTATQKLLEFGMLETLAALGPQAKIASNLIKIFGTAKDVPDCFEKLLEAMKMLVNPDNGGELGQAGVLIKKFKECVGASGQLCSVPIGSRALAELVKNLTRHERNKLVKAINNALKDISKAKQD